MAKLILVVGMAAMAVCVVTASWAEQEATSAAESKSNAMAAMMRQGRAQRPINPAAMMMTREKINQAVEIMVQMALMYKMIEPAKIVQAGDGGIIASFGNKLIKYDKDLNVVKEVKLDVDADAMNGMAAKLAQKYSDEIVRTAGMEGQNTPYSPPTSGAQSPAKTEEELREERIHQEIEQMK